MSEERSSWDEAPWWPEHRSASFHDQSAAAAAAAAQQLFAYKMGPPASAPFPPAQAAPPSPGVSSYHPPPHTWWYSPPPTHNQHLNQPMIRAKMPKVAKGSDAKPRGRMTAYAFFVQICREEHKKKHPQENVVFAEFSKKCAERWKTMSEKEKKRFHDLADKDKMRFEREMKVYIPSENEKGKRGKKRKQNKDPNAPKRALSAFIWFSNDERGKVKQENPEYGVGEIAKELGRRWSEADSTVKRKYEEMADKDKARYDRDMTEYKKKGKISIQAPPVKKDESEEEEDEEEDDE